jgi:2-oxoglutarate ferredoxin oxidoreductase subunit alpha
MDDSTDIQFAICGSAGDGTIAAGDILKRAMARLGYKVIAFDLYPAEIRGFGKCISRVRITTEQAYSLKRHSDVLVSLDDSYAIPHVPEVCDFGAVIYEDRPVARMPEGSHITAHIRPMQLPYALHQREISERATSSARSRNIVVLGYLSGLYGIPPEAFREVITAKFQTKAESVVTGNLAAFDAGWEAGKAVFKLDDATLGPPKHRDNGEAAVMMTGNGAVVRGCLDAGLDTFFGYPITPATTIMERLARELPKNGGRLLQTEDEISAIAATIGAGFTGARAATATSGPGLALMAEMLGLGVMAEVPSVVFVSQRAGPSTGMPTKTEQSDLNLAVFGGAGDAQRIVLAPTNVDGCYRVAGKAFEMAEKYQTPVIVLLDLYLSNRYETVIPPTVNPFAPNLNKGLAAAPKGEPYHRFAETDDLVSPRAVPGDKGGMHAVTGLEHNQFGKPNDQADLHMAMSAKRHGKLLAALDHPDFTVCKRFGDDGPVDVGVLGWGSTFGEILEALFAAQKEGIRCAAMKVVMLSPLPEQRIAAFFDDCGEVLIPELNYQGQFANLVCGHLGRPAVRMTRATGSPMPAGEILAEIRRLARSKAAASERTVA